MKAAMKSPLLPPAGAHGEAAVRVRALVMFVSGVFNHF